MDQTRAGGEDPGGEERKEGQGASLVVQWLRIRLAMRGTQV